jgi:hypothetical protein
MAMPADRKLGKGESLQVRAPVVALTMGGILILLATVAFGLTLFFHDRIGSRFVLRHAFPAPAVIPDERAQRLALEARQRHILEGAGRPMPINQAMKEIAARGPHAFDPVDR